MLFLLLRKLSSSSLPPSLSLSKSKLTIMASINTTTDGSLSRLSLLAQQLRLYKPPPPSSSSGSDGDDNNWVSQLGFPESVTSVGGDKKFSPNRAAVLICLFEGKNENDLRVILTKRSSGLSTHSGEVSLPGGKAEEDDVDDADTATREAKEEIGLNPSLVNVVTILEPFLSKHLLRVIPVVGILSDRNAFTPTPNAAEVDDVFDAPLDMFLKHLLRVIPVVGILSDRNAFTPTPNAAEVDDVFDAPLDMFLKDENRRSEEREWLGDRFLIHYFDYETGGKKYMIWGLTAGILIRAASIVYQRPPAFIEQSPKFKMPQ